MFIFAVRTTRKLEATKGCNFLFLRFNLSEPKPLEGAPSEKHTATFCIRDLETCHAPDTRCAFILLNWIFRPDESNIVARLLRPKLETLRDWSIPGTRLFRIFLSSEEIFF